MVQVRVSGDDAERVRLVARLLLDLVGDDNDSTLIHGDPTELLNRRGPGVRVVFDLRPRSDTSTGAQGVVIDAEIVTDPVPARRRSARGARRALPPGT